MTITRLHAPTSSVNSDETKITPLPASASSSMSRYVSSLPSTSTPWVGSSKMKMSAPLSSHLASTLVLVAAGQVADRVLLVGNLDVQALDDRPRVLALAAVVGDRQRTTRPVARKVGQRDVLAHGEVDDVALEPAVLRQEDDARAQRVARRPDGHLPAVNEDPAGGVPVGAVDQPDQLAAAGADEPGNPKELAPAEVEACILDDVRQGQALDAQQLLVAHGARGDAALAALGRGLGTPRNVLDQPLLGELLGAPRVDDAAVAHDRDVVGDLEDLVQAVRDVDDRDVALLE